MQKPYVVCTRSYRVSTIFLSAPDKILGSFVGVAPG